MKGCMMNLAKLYRDTMDDLEVQAMIFDMDIDIEALRLTPKNEYKEPIWITRWKEKRNDADLNEQFDYDRE